MNKIITPLNRRNIKTWVYSLSAVFAMLGLFILIMIYSDCFAESNELKKTNLSILTLITCFSGVVFIFFWEHIQTILEKMHLDQVGHHSYKDEGMKYFSLAMLVWVIAILLNFIPTQNLSITEFIGFNILSNLSSVLNNMLLILAISTFAYDKDGENSVKENLKNWTIVSIVCIILTVLMGLLAPLIFEINPMELKAEGTRNSKLAISFFPFLYSGITTVLLAFYLGKAFSFRKLTKFKYLTYFSLVLVLIHEFLVIGEGFVNKDISVIKNSGNISSKFFLIGLFFILGYSFISYLREKVAEQKEAEAYEFAAWKNLRPMILPHTISNLHVAQKVAYKKIHDKILALSSEHTELKDKSEYFLDTIKNKGDFFYDLLNYSLEDKIAIKDEIDFLRRYLATMSFRYRLQYDFKTSKNLNEPTVASFYIPSLFVLPYIENSVKAIREHSKNGKGEINIAFYESLENLKVVIEDNGGGLSMADLEKARKFMRIEIDSNLSKERNGKSITINTKRINYFNSFLEFPENHFSHEIDNIFLPGRRTPIGARVILTFPNNFSEVIKKINSKLNKNETNKNTNN